MYNRSIHYKFTARRFQSIVATNLSCKTPENAIMETTVAGHAPTAGIVMAVRLAGCASERVMVARVAGHASTAGRVMEAREFQSLKTLGVHIF